MVFMENIYEIRVYGRSKTSIATSTVKGLEAKENAIKNILSYAVGVTRIEVDTYSLSNSDVKVFIKE